MLLSMIFAWIGVLCALAAAFKFFTRISGSKKMNRLFYKLHIPLGIVLIITGLVHGLLAGNFSDTSLADVQLGAVLLSFNWGTACFIASLFLGLSYVLRKILRKKWMITHRILTIILLLLLLLHILDVGIQLPSRILNAGNSASHEQKISDNAADGSASFSGAQLKDGVYEGSAQGYQDTIRVSVTVENGIVKKIEILDNNDTPNYFEHARQIIDQIIDKQSLDVDAVSGATYSSAGIKNAVADALKSAVTSGELDHDETELPSDAHREHNGRKKRNRASAGNNSNSF